MSLRLTYAFGALLSFGLAGCLAADGADLDVDVDSASDALSAVRIEAENQSWSTSPGDKIEDNADNVKLRANSPTSTIASGRSNAVASSTSLCTASFIAVARGVGTSPRPART